MNKYQEELCGDHVETIKTKEGMIVVLSDGLGSGVKANILATLTSKIAITMLKEGASIEETISTIANTLPECQVRKLAYSTFTIVEIKETGEVYMVEYDNPPVFYYRKGEAFPLRKTKRTINNKVIYESNFKMRVGDTLVMISDGVVHAGVGMTLNLGWQWEHIDQYLKDLVRIEQEAPMIARDLLGVCENLYDSRPGDDTTVVAIKLQERTYLDLFTGPPKNKTSDHVMIEKIQEARGKVILCGGTTANIVAREIEETITIDLKNYNAKVPPMGYMEGIDLVTEGLLTLNATKEILSRYLEDKEKGLSVVRIGGLDGASRLAKMLVEDSTHITFWVGQAINPAHQNPDFPANFNLKNTVVKDVVNILVAIGKEVEVHQM
ncbi:MAG: SpoIIE family protein phosphatase [Niameybacter sp.]|uniref:SpoIIE family protein phosphatase n=1 Tax=Niameybacter sp. TaxID=2033640 RepID=UPI002FC5E529